MVFTVAATTAFFEDADQMSLSASLRTCLRNEGLEFVADLEEFDDSNLSTVTANVRNPSSIIDPAHQGPDVARFIRPQTIYVGSQVFDSSQGFG